jgi:hypothetical protein
MSNLSMLVYICESMKLHDVAEYWQSVITLNEYQQRRFVNTIVETMVNVKGKKIALLGFAYKPDTSDCRQSPAIDIAHAMLAEGARLSICDPQVPPESITAALGDHSSLQVGHLFAHAACALPLPVRPSGCWRGWPAPACPARSCCDESVRMRVCCDRSHNHAIPPHCLWRDTTGLGYSPGRSQSATT